MPARIGDAFTATIKRRLKDLSWEGIPVGIELRVRRFFSDTEDLSAFRTQYSDSRGAHAD
jgi:hypothetical protein